MNIPEDLLYKHQRRASARSECKDLLRWFLNGVSTRSSHKDLYQIMQGPLIYKSFSRGVVKDLDQDLHARTPKGIPQDRHKRCCCRSAIWHAQAQSAERVARAISKFAPRHNDSDPTRTKCLGCATDVTIRTVPQRERSDTHTKCREGCASYIKIPTAPQREQSDTHKVKRGLREHTLDIHKTWRAPQKKNITNVLLKSQQLFCRGLQNTAPAMKMSPGHPKCRICHTESSSCPKSKTNDESFTKTRLSTLSKRRPSSPNTVPATQNDLQNHLSFWRFSNVPKVPRLPRGWKSDRCPAPVTQNDIPDLKMSQKSHACHTKWHSSKNEHGALVKRDLWKRAKREAHFVRAFAVETHISHGTFMRIYSEMARDQMEHPDPTPAL